MSIRVYLKTVNTPKQRVFSACCAPFSLQYTKYSCEKMASSGGKSLAVGHISGFQIDPKILGNTAQKKVPKTAECDIINLWINR